MNSDVIDMSKKFHTLYLTGLYLNVTEVFLICLMGMDKDNGCVVKLRVKAEDEILMENVLEALL